MSNTLAPALPEATGGVASRYLSRDGIWNPKLQCAVSWFIRFLQGTTGGRIPGGGVVSAALPRLCGEGET